MADAKGPTEITVSGHEMTKNEEATQHNKTQREQPKFIPGFVFLCNSTTKLDCYRYRVFGLPWGKKEIVEQIKANAKLFLYDFEGKLLYGIYEATSDGKLNLEPAAFGGKFPAQVRFKIFKECLPLPDTTFRNIIKGNRTSSKFEQELNGNQVRKLLSSFQPLNGSSSQPALPSVMPPATMENPLVDTRSSTYMEGLYIGGMQHSQAPPFIKPQPCPNVNPSQHGCHSTGVHFGIMNPSSDLPNSSVAEPWDLQNQITGFEMRLRSIGTGDPQDHVRGHEMRRTLEHGASHGRVANSEMRSVEHMTPYARATGPEWHYHPSPLQWGPNVLAPGISQGTAPISSYFSYTTAREAQVAALGTSQGSAPISSYYSYTTAREAQIATLGISQGSAPVSSYYTYGTAPETQVPAPGILQGRASISPYDSYNTAGGTQGLAPGVPQGSDPVPSYYSYTAPDRQLNQ